MSRWRCCRASWSRSTATWTLPQDLDSLKLDGIPPEPLRAFLEDQGFKTLLLRLTGEQPMARPTDLRATPVTDATAPAAEVAARTGMPALPELPPIDCSTYATITDEAALDAIIAEAYAGGLLAIDTETDALDSVASGLVGISLATAPGRAAYVPVGHVSSDDMFGEKPPQLSLTTVAGQAGAASSRIRRCSRSGTTSNTTSTCWRGTA